MEEKSISIFNKNYTNLSIYQALSNSQISMSSLLTLHTVHLKQELS